MILHEPQWDWLGSQTGDHREQLKGRKVVTFKLVESDGEGSRQGRRCDPRLAGKDLVRAFGEQGEIFVDLGPELSIDTACSRA